MTDLITNGDFLTALTGWTEGVGGTISHQDSPSYDTGGCALLEEAAASGTCYLRQSPTTPATPTNGQMYRLSFALQCSNLGPPDPEVLGPAWFYVIVDATLSAHRELLAVPVHSSKGEWHRFSYDFVLPASLQYQITFYAGLNDAKFLLDAVSCVPLPSSTGSCDDLAWELAGLRFDRAMVKHPQSRYQGAINQAIREAPAVVWPTVINTTLTTVEEQRRYALATITALVDDEQLAAVYVEDEDDGHYYLKERWRVEDNAGVLTLVFDEDPEDADLTIKLEYFGEPAELDCTSLTDTTNLDRDWLVARAMTLLLLEADPETDDPATVAVLLQSWDLKRQAREGQLRPHFRGSNRAITQSWS